MSDLKERIDSILQQPQLAGLATITEDGKPWVRYVMTVADDNLEIRCGIEDRKIAPQFARGQLLCAGGLARKHNRYRCAPLRGVCDLYALAREAPSRQDRGKNTHRHTKRRSHRGPPRFLPGHDRVHAC